MPQTSAGISQRPQSMVSGCQQQQQASLSQSMYFSDPVGIISRAAKFLHWRLRQNDMGFGNFR